MIHKLKFLLYVGVTSISINILLICFYPNWLLIVLEKDKQNACLYQKCFGIRKPRWNNISNDFFNRRIKKYRVGEQIHFQISVQPKRIVMIISSIHLINDSRDGLHIFIFNQATGSFMAHFHVDIHGEHGTLSNDINHILQSVQDGRIMVVVYKNYNKIEIKFPIETFKTFLEFYNSYLLKMTKDGSEINSWILLSHKGVGKISETHQMKSSSEVNPSLKLSKSVPLSEEIAICPNWPDSERTKSRRRLCRLIEGYKSICSCSVPDSIPHFKRELNSTIIPIPIALVSGNDPHYLLRALSKLAHVYGIHLGNILVFIDHNYEESKLIVDLFQLRMIRVRVQPNLDVESRNSFKFRTAIATTFRHYYFTQKIIVMEDNVDAAEDLLYYFNQTSSIMDDDTRIFCISASKYKYSCPKSMEREVYIGEYFPSDTFMISRKLWQDELAVYWPDNLEDKTWKQWLEYYMMKSERFCVYPMVSRLFYFGRNAEFTSMTQGSQIISATFKPYKINHVSVSSYDSFLKKISASDLPKSIDKINCSNIQTLSEAKNLNAKIQFLPVRIPLSNDDNSSRWKIVRKCFSLTNAEIRSCWYKMSCTFCYRGIKVLLLGDDKVQLRALVKNETS